MLPAVRLAEVLARERAALAARMPRSQDLRARARAVMPDGVPMSWMASLFRHEVPFAAGGKGARFTDVDGNSYLDFNLVDLSNTVGYGETPVSRAVAAVAARGMQYMLPVEDAVAVSEYPYWSSAGFFP
jgi:glutamate-1-semialdehyde 2,1-aminomutase